MTIANVELLILRRLKDTGNKPINHPILSNITYSDDYCRKQDFETACVNLRQNDFVEGNVEYHRTTGNLQYDIGNFFQAAGEMLEKRNVEHGNLREQKRRLIKSDYVKKHVLCKKIAKNKKIHKKLVSGLGLAVCSAHGIMRP